MKVYITDFKMDFSHLGGVLTRSGEFVYSDGSHFKDWGNLKEVFGKYDYIPIYGKKTTGSHQKDQNSFLGYGYNFTFNDLNETVQWNGLLFEEIQNLTDLPDPTNQEFEVSIGFQDSTPNDYFQTINSIDHIAISLNNLERGRCRTAGGHACYGKIVRQDFSDNYQNLIEDFISHEESGEQFLEKKRYDVDVNKKDLLDRITRIKPVVNKIEEILPSIQKVCVEYEKKKKIEQKVDSLLKGVES